MSGYEHYPLTSAAATDRCHDPARRRIAAPVTGVCRGQDHPGFAAGGGPERLSAAAGDRQSAWRQVTAADGVTTAYLAQGWSWEGGHRGCWRRCGATGLAMRWSTIIWPRGSIWLASRRWILLSWARKGGADGFCQGLHSPLISLRRSQPERLSIIITISTMRTM